MKQFSLVLLLFLMMSCSNGDECDCYYSEEFNQYVPDERWEQSWRENPTTQERMDAIAAECRVQGCK